MPHNFENSFIEFCRKNKFEINKKQLEIVKFLESFFNTKKNLVIFFQKKKKNVFTFTAMLE